MTIENSRTGEHLVKVWDPLLRVFHWSLLILITAAWLTADGPKTLHEAIGYTLIGLMAFRLVWGIVGPRNARFASFVRGPKATLNYLRNLRHGRAQRFLGHNPAGAAMIVALLAAIAATLGSGWLMLTDAFWGSSLMEELHEAAATLILLLVPVHVAGVIFESLRHRENLVISMLDGKKRAGAAELQNIRT